MSRPLSPSVAPLPIRTDGAVPPLRLLERRAMQAPVRSAAPAQDLLTRLATWAEAQPAHHHLGSWIVGR